MVRCGCAERPSSSRVRQLNIMGNISLVDQFEWDMWEGRNCQGSASANALSWGWAGVRHHHRPTASKGTAELASEDPKPSE